MSIPAATHGNSTIDWSALGLHARDGVWYPSGCPSQVSYPDTGHDENLDVEERSFWFMHRNECIVAAMRRMPPPGEVLDVGAGNGYVAMSLQAAGFKTAVLEAGTTGIRNAQRRGVKTLVCAPFDDVHWRDDSVPAIGLFDVLEHVEDAPDFLSRLHRVMAPGGSIYVTVPALQALWSEEDVYAGHFRRYTVRSLTRDLRRAGFGVLYATYLFAPLPPAILLFRSLPGLMARLRMRKNARRAIAAYHAGGFRFGAKLLQPFWRLERAAVARGLRVPIGTSCLAVARK